MSLFSESRAYRIVSGDCARGRVSHAYLLVCPDMRNLRTFLKELAKLVMGADERSARLIDEESHSDCRIFPAEGEKMAVSDVKELLEGCYIKPVEGDRKVFVIDRMQDMLAPAQNKLLKVLEEPPENVYFLLGATGEYSVLTTVRSRTKRLELLSFSEEEPEAWLKENFPARTDAHEIAALSGGILGKAEELAEGDSLTQEAQEAARLLSTLSPAGIPAAVRSCTDRQAAARLLSLLRLTLHDALAYQLGIGKRVSAAQEDTLRRVANRFGAAALVSAQEQITRAEKNLKFNANLPMCLEELFAGILEGR